MKKPEFGEVLPAAHPSEEALTLMRLRRSTTADCLGAPGPAPDVMAELLEIAARAPDHRRVTPYRFIVFEGEARERFGEVLEGAFRKNNPDAKEEKVALERRRFCRAPVVVAVISKTDPTHRTPEWEQILTSGAVCQNLLVASLAHGFAAQWLTEWYAYDEDALAAMNLGENERVAGFVYIGTAQRDPKERARPDMTAIVSRF